MSQQRADNVDQAVLDRLAQLVGRPAGDAAPPSGGNSHTLANNLNRQRERLAREHEARRREILNQRDAARAEVHQSYERKKKSVSDRLSRATRKIHKRYRARLRTARDDRDQARLTAAQQYERIIRDADDNLWGRSEIFALQHQELSELVAAAEAAMDRSGFPTADEAYEPPPDDASRGPKRRFLSALERCRRALESLQAQASWQRSLQVWTPLLFVAVSAAAIFILGTILGWQGWHWILGGGAGGPLLLLLISYQAMLPAVRRRGTKAYTEFRHAAAHAEAAIEQMFATAKAKYSPSETGLLEQRDRKIADADARWKMAGSTLKVTRDRRIAENQQKVKQRRTTLAEDRDRQLAELEYRFQPQLEILAEEYELQLAHLAKSPLAPVLQLAVDEMNYLCRDRYPAWEAVDWHAWQSHVDAPPAVRIGDFLVRDETSSVALRVPAMLTFDRRPSLLLLTGEQGRSAASGVLQNIMLRMLTAFPPGVLTVTIVSSDLQPEGAGALEPFGEFVQHRQDVPALAATENTHVLVLPDFPGRFTDEQVRRIADRIGRGAPTLLCLDSQSASQCGFTSANLDAKALVLEYDKEGFRLAGELTDGLSLKLDPPPCDATIQAALEAVGEAMRRSGATTGDDPLLLSIATGEGSHEA